MFAPFSITAENLPEHARNPIHTDDGARAEGFERALVAGVTSYAYAVHPIVDALGIAWAEHGSAEVRFLSPVFRADRLTFPTEHRVNGDVHIEALVDRLDRPLFTVVASPTSSPMPARPLGEMLRVHTIVLEGEFGADYAEKAGDTMTLFRDRGFVHPAVWPALANNVYHAQLARGAWVHTRSKVRHFTLAPVGATAEVATTVTNRYMKRGERAVADVRITVNEKLVAHLEHEAIVDLSISEGSVIER